MSKFHYTVFSDGGSSRGGAAAGACLVDGHLSGRRRGAIVYLGEATNNEAEIAAALLGFSLIRLAVEKREEQGPIGIHWVSDSEYLLKGGTEYIKNWQKNGWRTASKEAVKNQGLWRAFLWLTKKLQISAEHVRGHTGHIENELCDLAANWAKDYAEDSIRYGERKVEVPGGELSFWFLADGRSFLERLRTGGEDEEVYDGLLEQLRNSVNGGEVDSAPTKKKAAKQPDEVTEALEELEGVQQKLTKLKKSAPEVKKLSNDLAALLKNWR